MSDVTVTVDAGVCRFKTVITATMDDEMNIVYKVKSECPAVREMAKNMRPIGMFDAMAKPLTENVIYPVPFHSAAAAVTGCSNPAKTPPEITWAQASCAVSAVNPVSSFFSQGKFFS